MSTRMAVHVHEMQTARSFEILFSDVQTTSNVKISLAQVPALPQGARVEIQPLLLAPPDLDVGSIPGPLRYSERTLALNPAAAVSKSGSNMNERMNRDADHKVDAKREPRC